MSNATAIDRTKIQIPLTHSISIGITCPIHTIHASGPIELNTRIDTCHGVTQTAYSSFSRRIVAGNILADDMCLRCLIGRNGIAVCFFFLATNKIKSAQTCRTSERTFVCLW